MSSENTCLVQISNFTALVMAAWVIRESSKHNVGDLCLLFFGSVPYSLVGETVSTSMSVPLYCTYG